MKYSIVRTGQFKRDYKLAKKRGKNIKLLLEIIEHLANGNPLDRKYNDHQLTGNFVGYRECHIEPNWLLIYKIEDNQLSLVLTRTGSHSDLF
jgi:mRNA interferase YafQ